MSHSIDCDYEVCQNHHKFLANFSVSLNLSNCLQVNIMNSTDIIVNTTIATTTYDTSVLIEFASPSQTTPMTKNITSTTTILPLISSIAPTLGQRLICPKNQAVCAAELFVKIPTGQYIIALDKSQFFSRKEPFLELLHLGSPKTHTWHATTHTSFFS